MNKGVVAAPPRHRFRICAPPFGPVRFRVLKTGGKEHGEVVVEPSGGRRPAEHRTQQGLRANAAGATAIGQDRRVAAYPTSSTRRLHGGSRRGAAVTSRRGRGEDSVYLDGDRWRG